jgi:hypothetical protein
MVEGDEASLMRWILMILHFWLAEREANIAKSCQKLHKVSLNSRKVAKSKPEIDTGSAWSRPLARGYLSKNGAQRIRIPSI